MPVPVSKFYDLIKTLKTKNDYVVVVIHWGTEYLLRPDENQVAIGHKLIDSGADVIFGSHPHVVEPVEVYKNRIIFYSLGNFVFDQDFGDTTVGLGAGVEFQKNKMLVTLYPFNLNKFRPEFMKEPKNTDYCEKLLDSIANTGCSFEVTTKN
jgi:poly-gamma-glutamate synthesis protein (capsule biosynthesis protein)